MDVRRKTVNGVELVYTQIGLGLAALGRPGYINLGHGQDLPPGHDKEAMRQYAITVLDAAWDAGVRYFDAARSYGAAEEFLATWLRIRHVDPKEVTVGSKWGYTYTANWKVDADKHEVKSHDLATLRRQIGESSQLHPWLKLYQVHSATLESGVLDRDEVLDELARLRDGGLIIGLSVSGPQQAATVEKAMTVKRGERQLFGSVQATWNLLEQSAETALAAAQHAGWLVIIKEALANGRLTRRGLPVDSPVMQLSETTRQPVDALALAAVLAQPWVDIVLSGAATVEHLQSNLKAPAITWKPDYDATLQGIIEKSEAYWSQRGLLRWN
jgi:aryl-alcohol dehydrogenase-like predicted oxidoreductase